MRAGSLFSGYGGLEIGIGRVLPLEVMWHCEFDSVPSRILEAHYPDVPNLGDITTVDWSSVARVDLLCGGFPCQDVSLAGLRKGLKDGTRSGLWSEFARAIGVLRPALVVIENVRGLTSAPAGMSGEEICDLESFEGDLGGLVRSDRPVLRALGAVLGDLADLGYDAEWCGVRASDAGAPHGRFRVFILAYAKRGADFERHGRSAFGRRSGNAKQAGVGGGTASANLGHERGGNSRHGRAGSANGRESATDASSERLGQHGGEPSAEETGTGSGHIADGPRGLRADTDWGPYLPAIRRWESVTGKPAPAPTNGDGKNGSHRLAARFVEWMMGLDEGHVTDPAIGLSRNEQLKALGNGVVPQQAALAVELLLSRQVLGVAP